MKNREGYLLIDNRAAGGDLLEAATITCSHCQTQIVRNPARIRERAYCPKCDHYICDACEALRIQTGTCKTFKEILDVVSDKIEHGEVFHNPLMQLATN